VNKDQFLMRQKMSARYVKQENSSMIKVNAKLVLTIQLVKDIKYL
jgi:hypothetical protein